METDGKNVSAKCLICTTSKCISGALMSTGNFLNHLKVCEDSYL